MTATREREQWIGDAWRMAHGASKIGKHYGEKCVRVKEVEATNRLPRKKEDH